MQDKYDVVVVGAGIVGLAYAYNAASLGQKVLVLERRPQSACTTSRTFGSIWPVGRPAGQLYKRALRSRMIWLDVLDRAKLWYNEHGSYFLAYSKEEFDVLEEFTETSKGQGYKTELLLPYQIEDRNPFFNRSGMWGGMYSSTEVTVDSEQVCKQLPLFLKEVYGVVFQYNTLAYKIEQGVVHTRSLQYKADHVFVCAGAEIESLYPEIYESEKLTKCKVQLIKTAPVSKQLKGGVVTGLGFLQEGSFKHLASIAKLQEFVQNEMPDYHKHGMYIRMAQNKAGELIIGGSHEYGLFPDLVDKELPNQLTLNYVKKYLKMSAWEITERWSGVYTDIKEAEELIVSPVEGVYIINALGNAGMTMAFGMAYDHINRIYSSSMIG